MPDIPLILIADDDPMSRSFLRDAVEQIFKFKTVEAKNIAEAVRITAEQKPDMVFLDQHLQDGTAADYCQEIAKASPALAAIPKWIVTGEKPLQWDQNFWQQYGVTGFFVKPIKITEVETAIKKSLPVGI